MATTRIATAPRVSRAPTLRAARDYFFADARRAIQTVLGLIWLLDGALQFQSFMYSKGFVGVLTGTEAGQPHWLASSIGWAAHIVSSAQTPLNTLFALTQVAIGVGLLYRPAVKSALVLSFGWSLIVWVFSEACGFMFGAGASPLTGAPGAVLLYALIGALVWPGARPGGLLGVRGARTAWAALWLVMAWLWLLPENSTANATSSAINAAPSGAGFLTSIQHGVATAAAGGGLAIALVLAGLSAAIGVAVGRNWRAREFLVVAIVLNAAYWVIPQGLGGILTGSGTDPNAGPLFILLAFALYSTVGAREPT
jgi:hypothetical protein